MIIHGREITLRRTIGAEIEISDMCPDGNIAGLADFLFKQNVFSRQIRNMAKFAAALSRAGEAYRKYQDADYEPEPLTVDEIMSLSASEFRELQDEALKVFADDGKTTVSADTSKKRRAVVE